MNEIKAIETEYGGTLFRSRLEARWAVFFDQLKLRWEYEKEGYKLPDGTLYLPDFYMTDMNLFIEIKPNIESLDSFWNKLYCFASNINSIACFVGTPAQYAGKIACMSVDDSGGGVIEAFASWATYYDKPVLVVTDRKEREYYANTDCSLELHKVINYPFANLNFFQYNDKEPSLSRSIRFDWKHK